MNEFLLIYGLVCVAFGIFACLTHQALESWLKYVQVRNDFPALHKINEKELCKLHTWAYMNLALRGLEPGRYSVCLTCGNVARTKLKVNKPGLEHYLEAKKLKESEYALNQDLLRLRQMKLDIAMNGIIKSFIETKDTVPVQNNIEFLQNFFRRSVIEIQEVDDFIAKEFNRGDRS